MTRRSRPFLTATLVALLSSFLVVGFAAPSLADHHGPSVVKNDPGPDPTSTTITSTHTPTSSSPGSSGSSGSGSPSSGGSTSSGTPSSSTSLFPGLGPTSGPSGHRPSSGCRVPIPSGPQVAGWMHGAGTANVLL